MDQTCATLYVPWMQEMMEDIAEDGPKWSRGRREMEKTFLEGVSLMDANVSIG
jgi:hypothetical protein